MIPAAAGFFVFVRPVVTVGAGESSFQTICKLSFSSASSFEHLSHVVADLFCPLNPMSRDEPDIVLMLDPAAFLSFFQAGSGGFPRVKEPQSVDVQEIPDVACRQRMAIAQGD
jgi:hypothetical protein